MPLCNRISADLKDLQSEKSAVSFEYKSQHIESLTQKEENDFDCVFVPFLQPEFTAIKRTAKFFHMKRNHCSLNFTDGSDGKQYVCNVGDLGSIS